jgi:hypothetical protein
MSKHRGILHALLSVWLTAIVLGNTSGAISSDRNAGASYSDRTMTHEEDREQDSSGDPSTAQALTLQTNAGTYIVVPGQAALVTVTVNTNGSGFSGYLSYACTDTAPESICIAPALPVSSSVPASFTVTTTPPTTGSLHRPLFDRRGGLFYAALLPGLLGIMFTTGLSKGSRQRMRLLAMIVMLGLFIAGLNSCGGSNNSSSNNPGTAKGSYPITITATSAAGTAAATGQVQVTLEVQ